MNTIQRAALSDLRGLLSICGRYHTFEGLVTTEADREKALIPLLQDNSLGLILISRENPDITGYLAVCLGYSIELGGKEAFIDEFFIEEAWRGQGIGDALLDAAIEYLASIHVVALHLEVSRQNLKAIEFYSKQEFEARDKYFLMTRLLTSDDSG